MGSEGILRTATKDVSSTCVWQADQDMLLLMACGGCDAALWVPRVRQMQSRGKEMAYMCGFVVFVSSRHEGVDLPLLLPLGSISWGVCVTEHTKKRKRD